MSDPAQAVRVCILAGDRTADDPLCRAQGVPGKALVRVGDAPLLGHVLKAIQAWPRRGDIVLVAHKTPPFERVVDELDQLRARVVWREPAERLYDSIRNAFADQPAGQRGLIVSGDHALLKPAWLEQVYQGLCAGAEMTVALAWHKTVMAQFPSSRRTHYRFADGAVCGGNVFGCQMPQLMKVLDIWQRMESERKKPWKVLSLLGVRQVARYLAGQLTVTEAFSSLSSKTGVAVAPILIDDGEVAVDVDSMADLQLVERAMAQRMSTDQSGQASTC